MNLHWTEPSIWDACAASGGINGMDARGTRAKNVKSCRLGPNSRPQIRVSGKVRVSNGGVRADSLPGHSKARRNAKRQARKRAQKAL
jgi:hypothetical protein